MRIALILRLTMIALSKGCSTDITTKGSSRLKITNNIFWRLLSYKRRLLSLEREKNKALCETNAILSAYVALLIDEMGEARISRSEVRNSIGNYSATVRAEGDDYVISVASSKKGVFSVDREKVAADG